MPKISNLKEGDMLVIEIVPTEQVVKQDVIPDNPNRSCFVVTGKPNITSTEVIVDARIGHKWQILTFEKDVELDGNAITTARQDNEFLRSKTSQVKPVLVTVFVSERIKHYT